MKEWPYVEPPVSDTGDGPNAITVLHITPEGIASLRKVKQVYLDRDWWNGMTASRIRVQDRDLVLIHKRVADITDHVSVSYAYYDLGHMQDEAIDLVKGFAIVARGVPGGVWRSLTSEDVKVLLERIETDCDGYSILWVDEPQAQHIAEEYKSLRYWTICGPGTDCCAVRDARPWTAKWKEADWKAEGAGRLPYGQTPDSLPFRVNGPSSEEIDEEEVAEELKRKRRPWSQSCDPYDAQKKAERMKKRRQRAQDRLEKLIEEKGVKEGMEEYLRQQEEDYVEEHGGIAGMEGGEQRWDRL